MNDKRTIPALTLMSPQEDGDPWLVTLNDYDPDDPEDISTAARFDTKEQAEAWIADARSDALKLA